jgi:thiopeptide-type bacteriocin biosynthesis protein
MAGVRVRPEWRALPPGSDWIYLKAYGGPGLLDEALTSVLPPLLETASAWGIISRWFFIRYADPDQHVRIRFNGPPDRLTRELTPLICEAFNPLLTSGRIWKLQFDTYQREVERYGGPEAMLIAEDIFHADSEAALAILQALEGDEGIEMRWRLALLGVSRLISDFGFDAEGSRAMAERMRDAFHREFRVEASHKRQLAERFRRERQELESVLDESSKGIPEFDAARRIFGQRSLRVVEAVRRLHALSDLGELYTDVADLLPSFAHMHLNRLMRAGARQEEMILYDFLHRLYDGHIAKNSRAFEVAAQ